jgi:transcriptional regulator with XRE-family HTH domain
VQTLKDLRKNAGLTLAELADRSGASLSLISKFERGERNISGKWVRVLANVLAVPETDIIGENVKTAAVLEGVPWFLQLQTHVVDTDDMDRVIPNGSTIYIEGTQEIRDGWVYLIRVGHDWYIRRARLQNGPLRFEGDSWSSTPTPLFLTGGFQIVGRVRGVANEVA